MAVRYIAPTWAQHLRVPAARYRLMAFPYPTPVQKWDLPGVPPGFDVYIKRDDLSGALPRRFVWCPCVCWLRR